MLLYVIPFVLLLVIAIFLKKREAAQQDDSSATKGSSRKKASKKVAKTKAVKTTHKRKAARIVEDPIATQQKTSTPIPADVHRKIENLIEQRNYFSAEAQINQALNRDNTQHELYLLLLKIHLDQKDEFAINQLIQHLHSLGLEEIARQAEQKYQAYNQQQQPDAIEFAVTTDVPEPAPVTLSQPHAHNSADFDALVQQAPVNIPVLTPSFDELQAEPAPSVQPKEAVVELAPLEFNFGEINTKPTETEQPPQATVLDQDRTVDFSFPLESQEERSTDKTALAQEQSQNQSVPLALDFNFGELHLSPQEEEKPESVKPVTLDFETVPSATHAPASGLDFKLEPVEISTEPALSEPQVSSVHASETSAVVSTTDIHQNDPLVQAFPELAQINAINLDLELAQRYVELGAYESARHLLSQNQDQFNPEQQEQSKKILNQIAS